LNRARRIRLLGAALVAVLPAAFAAPAAAQDGQPAVRPDTVPPGVPAAVSADTATRPLTPRGAFVRSLVVPGWGQAPFEAYFRGGVYFAGWTGNWFMNFKNQVRLQEARNMLEIRTVQIREALIAAAPDPDSMRIILETTNILDLAVQADPTATDTRSLIRSREQQREDWIAWSLFWLLASGVDAYVTAHLWDFPATIQVDPGMDRSVSLRVDLPFPRRRP
jgi:hypothetical protein